MVLTCLAQGKAPQAGGRVPFLVRHIGVVVLSSDTDLDHVAGLVFTGVLDINLYKEGTRKLCAFL